MCYASPFKDPYQQPQKKNNRKLAEFFNKTYKKSRFVKKYPVTKSYLYAKRKTMQLPLKGKILVKKWKGQKEIIRVRGGYYRHRRHWT